MTTDTYKPTHLVCCDPDRALCGVDLSTGRDLPDATVLDCDLCYLLDEHGASCGGRFCRLRQWWREHFGRTR